MIKLYKSGEKSKAICPFCHQMEKTTFVERSVPLSSGKGMVGNVLVAVCDRCDHVVAIPQQSVPRIKEVLHFSRHSVETRIPRHLLDALMLICDELGYGTSESKQTVLFRFYLNKITQMKKNWIHLNKWSHSEEAKGKADARFSIKLNDPLYQSFLKLGVETQLNQSELVKGIIVQMKNDLLDQGKKALKDSLRELLLVSF